MQIKYAQAMGGRLLFEFTPRNAYGVLRLINDLQLVDKTKSKAINLIKNAPQAH